MSETLKSSITKVDLRKAHKMSLANKELMTKAETCGCFYCIKIYKPEEIEDWVDDKNGKTAICPYCAIDSVLSDNCGFSITIEFLKEMNQYYFNRSTD